MKTLFNKNKQQTQRTKEQEQEIILTGESSFHIKEAYKATRTNIMFSLAGKGCKRIVVTSSFPGEGKSTTCINLAITFAQTGSRVLLIDGDMRKPTVHRKLDMTNGNGLAHLLSNFCTVEEAIQHTSYENLDAITSGHIPPNPAELLASEAMGELLETLEQDYDYIFIDTPPLNVVTDATVLSQRVSGTVVVVREGVTHHRDVQDAIGKLEFANAKVLGFILHDVKEGKGSKYGKYGKYSRYAYKNDAYTQYGQ